MIVDSFLFQKSAFKGQKKFLNKEKVTTKNYHCWSVCNFAINVIYC